MSSSSSSASVDTAALHEGLHQIIFSNQPMTETLGQVAQLAHEAMPGRPEVSVTFVGPQGPRTVAFSGSLAVHLDERQYEAGFGPCLDAAESGEMIKVRTDEENGRYAGFAELARRQGVTQSVSIGLAANLQSLGGLNVYSTDPRPFDEDDERALVSIAGYISAFLANLGLYHDAKDLAEGLQTAMMTRAMIEQAKGVIIANEHCSPEAAFDIMVRLSQNQNMKVKDLAGLIVRRAATER